LGKNHNLVKRLGQYFGENKNFGKNRSLRQNSKIEILTKNQEWKFWPKIEI